MGLDSCQYRGAEETISDSFIGTSRPTLMVAALKLRRVLGPALVLFDRHIKYLHIDVRGTYNKLKHIIRTTSA